MKSENSRDEFLPGLEPEEEKPRDIDRWKRFLKTETGESLMEIAIAETEKRKASGRTVSSTLLEELARHDHGLHFSNAFREGISREVMARREDLKDMFTTRSSRYDRS